MTTPMQTDAEVAAIAAWVRAGNHDWPLECEGECYGVPLHSSLMRPLVRRGLFDRIERKGFQTRWALTKFGDRVAQHLKQENAK